MPRSPSPWSSEDRTGRVSDVAYDLGRPTSALRYLLRGVHALVLEANHDEVQLRTSDYPPVVQRRIAGSTGHLSNRAAAELLAELHHPGLGAVVLAHLSEHCNTAADAQDHRCARAPAGRLSWRAPRGRSGPAVSAYSGSPKRRCSAGAGVVAHSTVDLFRNPSTSRSTQATPLRPGQTNASRRDLTQARHIRQVAGTAAYPVRGSKISEVRIRPQRIRSQREDVRRLRFASARTAPPPTRLPELPPRPHKDIRTTAVRTHGNTDTRSS